MTRDGLLWLALTLTGALLLVAHVVLVVTCLGRRELSWPKRWLSLLPPLAPWVAWSAGSRVLPLVWGLLIGAYLILRLSG